MIYLKKKQQKKNPKIKPIPNSSNTCGCHICISVMKVERFKKLITQMDAHHGLSWQTGLPMSKVKILLRKH